MYLLLRFERGFVDTPAMKPERMSCASLLSVGATSPPATDLGAPRWPLEPEPVPPGQPAPNHG